MADTIEEQILQDVKTWLESMNTKTSIVLQAPGGTKWDVKITNDGVLQTVSGATGTVETPKFRAPDATVWALGITNDGILQATASSGATEPARQLQAPDLGIWRFRVLNNGVFEMKNGRSTIKYVDRDRVNPLTLPIFPAAIMIDLSSAPEKMPTSVDRVDLDLLIEFWVMIEKRQAEAAATTLNRLIGNAHKTLVLEDPRRNGKAQNTIWMGTESVYIDGNEAMRGKQLRLQIQYRSKIGDPFSLP